MKNLQIMINSICRDNSCISKPVVCSQDTLLVDLCLKSHSPWAGFCPMSPSYSRHCPPHSCPFLPPLSCCFLFLPFHYINNSRLGGTLTKKKKKKKENRREEKPKKTITSVFSQSTYSHSALVLLSYFLLWSANLPENVVSTHSLHILPSHFFSSTCSSLISDLTEPTHTLWLIFDPCGTCTPGLVPHLGSCLLVLWPHKLPAFLTSLFSSQSSHQTPCL